MVTMIGQGSLSGRVLAAASRVRGAVNRGLHRVDPCDDPGAEPLTLLPLVALVAALYGSVASFWQWRFPPLQDLGHHLAIAAVVADWGRPGSLYTSLYEPFDPLNANSLLYLVAGYGGRLVGVTCAVRLGIVFYLVGVPLANLYAARVFGRSAWVSVLAVPLVYTMNYVAGFANLLFAAPFVVVTIPVFYRYLTRPSWRRGAFAALLVALVFLAHAHAFLWTGAMLFVMTAAMAVANAVGRGAGSAGSTIARVRRGAAVAGASFAAVVPALLLFYRWYERTFGAGRTHGGVMAATASARDGFGAIFKPTEVLWTGLPAVALRVLTDRREGMLLVVLLALVGLATAIARLDGWKRPPVMELAFVVTLVSYFVLPEGLQGHDIIASRQPGIAFWFLPSLVSPVAARVTRVGRALVIAGILVFAFAHQRLLDENLLKFSEETRGLEEVLDAAPPRARMHYVKIDTTSGYFQWAPLRHVEKFYMSDKFGQTPDTPGILSTGTVRYRDGVDIHRISGSDGNWPLDDEIWRNFDLVLVHRWKPNPAALAAATARGELVAKTGDWELWRSRTAQPR